ncbi:MAG: PsbP-related protein [Methanobacterium sp.]
MNGPLKKDNRVNLRSSIRSNNKRNIPPFAAKYRRELLAGAIAVLIALLIIILTSSGGTPVQNGIGGSINETPKMPVKIYSAGGIYLEYPESWNITTDEVNGNNMQIVIQDPISISDPNGTKAAGFTIFKVQKDPYETLEQRKDVFIQSLSNSGANIAPINTTNTTINGINATETIYDGKGPKNEQIQLKLIYFEQKDIIYIMACLTKGMALETQSQYFDVILNSFKLQ